MVLSWNEIARLLPAVVFWVNQPEEVADTHEDSFDNESFGVPNIELLFN